MRPMPPPRPRPGFPGGTSYHCSYLQPQNGGLGGEDVCAGGGHRKSSWCGWAEGLALGKLTVPLRLPPLCRCGQPAGEACLPACIQLLPTQLPAERGVALPGAGQDGGEEQERGQRQQDGQHHHSSWWDSRQESRDDTGKGGMGVGELRTSFLVLWATQRKGGTAFPFQSHCRS